MGHPSVYPTGVTIYDPEKSYNGYTIMPVIGIGAVLINMNGEVIRNWIDLQGFPNKLLPGGYVFGHLSARASQYGYQEQNDVVQLDWNGNVVWKFANKAYAAELNKNVARQHHDYQRAGNTVGYYYPGETCKIEKGNTLILTHETLTKSSISSKKLLDDCIIEVDWEGNILWQWKASEHFREMNFSAAAKNALSRNPNLVNSEGGVGNWLNIDAISYLGDNQWYDRGYEQFHPENIIFSSRQANIIAIIEKATGKLVWQIGPEFSANSKLHRIGQIIGPNHAHMIPEGLPGAGNILIFDNGGWAGYGSPNNQSFDGVNCLKADRSRILEIDPMTLDIQWSFLANQLGYGRPGILDHRFYSPLGGAAQRLPNGNTLITESVSGRLLEVTAKKEVAWEYYSPFTVGTNYIYRAFRYPYEYLPQVAVHPEIAIERIDNSTFRVPGAALGNIDNVIEVEGTMGFPKKADACVNKL